MIQKVHIQNFRCLRDVELTLEPLTVLVGPNSSGKTTLMEGLKAYDRSVLSLSDFWQQNTASAIEITWTLYSMSSHTVRSSVTRDGSYQFSSLNESGFGSAQSIQFDLAALRQDNTLAREHNLSPEGGNLTNVYASLTRQNQGAVAKELCRLVPMFSDVDVQPIDRGRLQFRFQDRWNPGFWLSPHQVSDGTMLLLAFIVIQYQMPQVKLITIEEPERALHPYLLDELIQLLRKMTTGEIGKNPVQVVLATHSAELLEYVRPEEVRFLTRSPEDGSVQVNQASTGSENWRRVYEEYKRSLGSIWLSGGMGGVPGE